MMARNNLGCNQRFSLRYFKPLYILASSVKYKTMLEILVREIALGPVVEEEGDLSLSMDVKKKYVGVVGISYILSIL